MPSAANAEDGVRPKHDEAGGLQLKTLITPLVLAAAVGLAITVTWFSSSEPMSPVGEVV